MELSQTEVTALLKGKELFSYLFEKKLPLDFQQKLNKFRATASKGKGKASNKDLFARNLASVLQDKKFGINPGTPQKGPWVASKLILHVTDYHCTVCRQNYQAPDSPILIQFAHPRQGSRTEIADGRGIDLPREIMRTQKNTAGCPLCFDLDDMMLNILDSARNINSRQLDFFKEKKEEQADA